MTASPKSGVRGPESFKKPHHLWFLRVLCASKDSTQSTQRVSVSSVLNLFPQQRTQRRASWLRLGSVALLVGLMFTPGCGGGSTTTTTTTPPPRRWPTSVTVTVNSGPANNAVNMAYVNVQVCSAGATTNCVTIPNVQLDTGSSGLRILASNPGVSGLNLTQVTDPNKTPVYECYAYPDGAYLWGPVMQAGLSMAGENATSVPIQIIDNAPRPPTCSALVTPAGAVTSALPQRSRRTASWALAPLCRIAGASAQVVRSCPITGSVPPAQLAPVRRQSNADAGFQSRGFLQQRDNNGVMLTMGSVVSAASARLREP